MLHWDPEQDTPEPATREEKIELLVGIILLDIALILVVLIFG